MQRAALLEGCAGGLLEKVVSGWTADVVRQAHGDSLRHGYALQDIEVALNGVRIDAELGQRSGHVFG